MCRFTSFSRLPERALSNILKDLNPAVKHLRCEDLVLPVDVQAGQERKLPGRRTQRPHRQQRLSLRGQDLKIVELGIGHIHVPFRIHRDPLGPDKLARPVALLALVAARRASTEFIYFNF